MNGKIEKLLAQANAKDAEKCSTASAQRVFSEEISAERFFRKLNEKLFAVDEWNADSEITSFALHKSDYSPIEENSAVVGDYIKTVLPGSGKEDWVRIIDIFTAPDETVMTVQPSPNPTIEAHEQTISHFFVADSTNNFCLQKVGLKIIFYVIGLNEQTNTEQTGGIVETFRNAATANLGRYLGVQKTQWQTFCDNFIA